MHLDDHPSVWMILPDQSEIMSHISPSFDKDLMKAPIEYLLHFLLIKGDFL